MSKANKSAQCEQSEPLKAYSKCWKFMAVIGVIWMEQNWLMGLYPEIMGMKELQNMLSGCNSIDEVKGKVCNWIGNVVDEMEAIDEKDRTAIELRKIGERIENVDDIETVKSGVKGLLENYAIKVIEWEEKLMKEKLGQLETLKRASLGG